MKERYFVVTLCNYTEENVPDNFVDVVVSSNINLCLLPVHFVRQNELIQEAIKENCCEGVLRVREISKEDYLEEYGEDEYVIPFDSCLPEYEVEHITKENRKWFAEIVFKKGDNNHNLLRYHTSDTLGWDGVSYIELKDFLKNNFKIQIPNISDLNLIKKTTAREIYVIRNGIENRLLAVFEEFLTTKNMPLDNDAKQGLLSGIVHVVNSTKCDIQTDWNCFAGKLQLEDGCVKVRTPHLQEYIEKYSME